LIAQLAPAGRVGPHVVLLCVNSPGLLLGGFDMLMAMLLMARSAVAVFVSVSVSALLALPTIGLSKFRLAADNTRESVCSRIDTV